MRSMSTLRNGFGAQLPLHGLLSSVKRGKAVAQRTLSESTAISVCTPPAVKSLSSVWDSSRVFLNTQHVTAARI